MMVVLTAIYFIGVWAIRAQIWRMGGIVQRLLGQLRQDIFDKVQSLPVSFFDRSEAGDLMSRLLNDVNTVNQAFGLTIPQVLGQTFSLVGIIIAMLSINLQLGLLSNLVVPLMIFTTGVFLSLGQSAVSPDPANHWRSVGQAGRGYRQRARGPSL
jgi:ATP-binding cassette subfamily B multidrug efflux pump